MRLELRREELGDAQPVDLRSARISQTEIPARAGMTGGWWVAFAGTYAAITPASQPNIARFRGTPQ
jgi:hypothetical protein